jgi:Spy/CpxP family protein refolding chaperone
MNRTKIRLIAGIVALFIIGGGIGLLSDRLYMEHKLRRLTEVTPEQRKAYILQKYTKELHLTEAQQVEIRKILDEKSDEIAQNTQRYKENIDKIRQHYDARIKALLTPEQQQLYDEMKQRIKERWKKNKNN